MKMKVNEGEQVMVCANHGIFHKFNYETHIEKDALMDSRLRIIGDRDIIPEAVITNPNNSHYFAYWVYSRRCPQCDSEISQYHYVEKIRPDGHTMNIAQEDTWVKRRLRELSESAILVPSIPWNQLLPED
jgi:hypothetical protein